MTFLNPVVLLGLVAAGIPLIIHLINLRKPRRVDFSSLAFLEELRQQTMRKLKVKQWLLLALRTLAIAFLVLAFARPTIESQSVAGLTSGRRSVAVIVDNSLSMDLRDQRGSYLTQAVDVASQFIGLLTPADQLAILPLVDDGLPHPLGQPTLAAAELDQITPSFGSARLGRALDDAAATLSDAVHRSTEIYLVSDMQRTNFSDSTVAQSFDAHRIVLVPVGEQSADNVAITGARVASSIVDIDQTVVVEVDVRNFGTQAVRNWGLSAYLDNERVAQSTATLEANEAATVSISVTPRSRGWLRGRMVLEDDAFLYDNEWFFTLHVPEERRILIVRGAGRDTAFLDLVLSTELRDGRRLFQLDEAEEGSVSGTFSGDYDAVVLLGVRAVAPGLASALRSFLAHGGGVMLFAGEEAAEGAYNEILSSIGGGTFSGLAAASGGSGLTTLDRLDLEHPLFRSVFEDEDVSSEGIERPLIAKMVRYLPGEGDEQTLAATTIGLPMLQEIRYEGGRMLIAPFLPDPEWSDLPVRGLFVPLLFRSMYYLTSNLDAFDRGAQSGDRATYRVAAARDVGQLRLVSQTGQEWIPEQRASGRGLHFTLPATLLEPGVYDVVANQSTIQRFAVNLDSRESDLERMDATDAAQWIQGRTGSEPSVLEVTSSGSAIGSVQIARETGVEIWNVFLTLALVILVAEMLVAARWKPAQASGFSA
jgi:hypothetical protein